MDELSGIANLAAGFRAELGPPVEELIALTTDPRQMTVKQLLQSVNILRRQAAVAKAERDQLRDLWQGLAKSMREIHFVHPMNVKDPDRQYCDADNEPWPCPTYRRITKAVGE